MVEKIRILQIVTLCLAVLCIVLLSLTIHYGTREEPSPEKEFVNETSKEYILNKFGEFFRTDEEQTEFAFKYNKYRSESTKSDACDSPASPRRHTRSTNDSLSSPSASSVINVCCKAEPIWISPETAEDIDGQTVTLVQYDHERQIFASEKCCQIADCNQCQCGQSNYEQRAVVMNPNDGPSMIVTSIILKGCCICTNVS